MAKIIAALVLLASLLGYHFYAIYEANQAGKNEIQTLWNNDKIARQAVVDQLLKEKEEDETKLKQKFDEEIQKWKDTNEKVNAAYLDNVAELERMREQLKRASTGSKGKPLDPGNSCTAHAARITQLADLLREGTELHVESLRYLEQLGNKVDTLQSIIKNVQQTNR